MRTASAKINARKWAHDALSRLSPSWVREASEALCKNLAGLEDPEPSSPVLAFYPAFQGEVDLSRYLSAQTAAGRPVCLPVCTEGQADMHFVIVAAWPPQMVPGPFRTLEPEPGKRLDIEQARALLIMVPGLAFTPRGERLGRGGGFYDRFLAERGSLCVTTVGVCWEAQVLDSLPVAEHDRTVQWICTEKRLFRTEPSR